MCSVYDEEQDVKSLKRWLLPKIDQGRFIDAEWLDEQKIFLKIPWPKKDEPNWEIFYEIFKEWSVFKGKCDESNPAEKAKSRFRCAMHRSPYFERVPEMCETNKQTGNFWVYKVLNTVEIKEKKTILKSKRRKISSSRVQSPSTKIPTAGNCINGSLQHDMPQSLQQHQSPSPQSSEGSMVTQCHSEMSHKRPLQQQQKQQYKHQREQRQQQTHFSNELQQQHHGQKMQQSFFQQQQEHLDENQLQQQQPQHLNVKQNQQQQQEHVDQNQHQQLQPSTEKRHQQSFNLQTQTLSREITSREPTNETPTTSQSSQSTPLIQQALMKEAPKPRDEPFSDLQHVTDFSGASSLGNISLSDLISSPSECGLLEVGDTATVLSEPSSNSQPAETETSPSIFDWLRNYNVDYGDLYRYKVSVVCDQTPHYEATFDLQSHGVRLYYGEEARFQEALIMLEDRDRGSTGLDVHSLPVKLPIYSGQNQGVLNILNHFEQGFTLKCDGDSGLVIRRMGQATMHYYPAYGEAAIPVKIKRDHQEPTRLFCWRRFSAQMASCARQPSGPRPRDEVKLHLGTVPRSPDQRGLVSVYVESTAARKLLDCAFGSRSLLDFSCVNSIDRLLRSCKM